MSFLWIQYYYTLVLIFNDLLFFCRARVTPARGYMSSISSLTRLQEDEHVYIDPEDAAMLADTSIWVPNGYNLYQNANMRKPDGRSEPSSRRQSGHSKNSNNMMKAVTLDDDPKSAKNESVA